MFAESKNIQTDVQIAFRNFYLSILGANCLQFFIYAYSGKKKTTSVPRGAGNSLFSPFCGIDAAGPPILERVSGREILQYQTLAFTVRIRDRFPSGPHVFCAFTQIRPQKSPDLNISDKKVYFVGGFHLIWNSRKETNKTERIWGSKIFLILCTFPGSIRAA